jgi:hypothetical protein
MAADGHRPWSARAVRPDGYLSRNLFALVRDRKFCLDLLAMPFLIDP